MKTTINFDNVQFICIMMCLSICFSTAYAQKIDVKEKAKNAAANRADGKVNEGINKGLDKIEEGIGGLFKKKDKNTSETKAKNSKEEKGNSNSQGQDEPAFSTQNKFDFIPGDKILAFDDFKQDAVGDLPAKWNSTGGCEIVKVNGATGNWAQLSGAEAIFSPQYISKLPDNCTIDFDMIVTCNKESNWYQQFGIEIISSGSLKGQNEKAWMPANTGLAFDVKPRSKEVTATIRVKGETMSESTGQYAKLAFAKPIRISIMRQQQRVKIYFDEKKMYDLPQGLPIAQNYYLRFSSWVQDEGDAETTKLYISNLRYAVGKPDMRNKLLTVGKLVTRGILFDVGSAVIKSESAGVLKEIASILNENKDLKVKIVGHTDSDGDKAKNLTLSEQRAMAIKTTLVKNYDVNEDHLMAEGKGASLPVDVNTTAAGKANNRRVEFIKL
jgi:OOP family OmpA-OmpF porin